MNGSMTVTSEPGVGSTFRVAIPLVEAAEEPERAEFKLRGQGGGDILLAEDNPINRTVATRMLERLGYRVVAVPDGRAAVEALEQAQFAAVLMDCQMPELDGYAATRAIRGLRTAAAGIPIIAVTANAMEGDRERCLAAGMDDFLPKPLDLADLDAMLRRFTWRPLGAPHSSGSTR